MTTGEKILHGGGYLIEDATAGTVFTPEDFSDEQLQLADTTDQFLREKVLPHVEKLENHDFDLMVTLLRQSGELGLLMIDAPEEYGGLDLPKTTSMLAAEKVSIYGGFSVAYTAHSGIGTLPLVYYGTKGQKEKYLGKIITGEWMAAYCLTEPDSGSDALGAKATATLTPDGKHYLDLARGLRGRHRDRIARARRAGLPGDDNDRWRTSPDRPSGAVTLTAGNLNTGIIAAQADVSAAVGYGGGSGTLRFDGGGAQSFTGAATTVAGNLPMVNIDKPSGTLTLVGTLRTASNWTYTAGTVDPGTSLVVFAGGTVTGSHTLNALDFRATTTIAAGTTLTAGGSLTLTAGNLNTGTVAARSDISVAAGYGGGSGVLLVNGSGAQTLTNSATTAAGNIPQLNINKPSGTLTLVGTIRPRTAGRTPPARSTRGRRSSCSPRRSRSVAATA